MVDRTKYGRPTHASRSRRICSASAWLPGVRRDDGQEADRGDKQGQVQQRLPTGFQVTAGSVGISVTAQQHELEEEQASGPDARTATEPGQNKLGDKGLHLEQKECS